MPTPAPTPTPTPTAPNPPSGGGTPGSELVLYNLGDGTEPSLPYAGLIEDSEGNFYGTTELGGANNQGTVFELSPASSGGWTATVLYSFGGEPDGAQPHGGLLLDSTGNLYGTTNFGGSTNCSQGCGTVFKLAPGSPTWSESVLHAFTGGSDGQEPNARLVLDSQGNLYGTTMLGGNAGTVCASGCGTVFRLALASSSWQESVLYAFTGGKDGAAPYAGLTIDSAGNLYGTASAGGSTGSGTVFKLTQGSSAWTETVLHAFSGGWGGKAPLSDVILDAAGNLFGTTSQGGRAGSYGVAFELLPQSNGLYREVVLHAFGDAPAASPMAGLVSDSAGNLYGITTLGAGLSPCTTGCGTLFKLAPSNGGFVFSVLHLFGRGTDGYNPSGDLILGSNGDLLGTTQAGGSQNAGIIFEIVP